MTPKTKRRALEQGTASKSQISVKSIPHRVKTRKRITRRAVGAELKFLAAGKVGAP
jgi:hypothetical protein